MKLMYFTGAALLLSACGNEPVGVPSADAKAGNVVLVDDGTPVAAMVAPVAADAIVQPTDAATYLAMAGAADKWESESSRVLLTKSTRPAVRSFAQMIINQHGQASAKVKAAAAKAKAMVPTATLAVDQQGMLSEIRTAPAQDVDAVYLRHQRAVHARTLALHQGFAANGDTPELQQVAAALVPVFEQHIAELDRVARSVPAVGG